MVDQTTTKSMGIIRDLKIYVHGIFYITMFTILQNSVVDFSYIPWLRDAKVAHDRGNNTISI